VFEKLGYGVDDSPGARGYADDPGDITLSIDRATFAARHAQLLSEIRFTARSDDPSGSPSR
jgi:hypothetical protein